MLGIAALEVMNRFNQRTVLSVGTTRAAEVYQKEVFRLACSVSNIDNFVQLSSLTLSSIRS
jgi:DNA repair protein RadC